MLNYRSNMSLRLTQGQMERVHRLEGRIVIDLGCLDRMNTSSGEHCRR